MLYSPRYTAVLDANVIFKPKARDYILELGAVGMYTPKWTEEILDEWTRNVLKRYPDLDPDRIEHTRSSMNNAFLDSIVDGYQDLIPSLNLPDPDDRHVLAAAIRCNADCIVTENMRDFPSGQLSKYDIEAKHYDDFVLDMIELDPEKALLALKNIERRLVNPPMTLTDIIEGLSRNDVHKSARRLTALLGKGGY